MMDEPIILSEGGPENKRLRISLDYFKGHPLLQIRYFYIDDAGKLKPTNKGIAIPRNRYLDLAETVQQRNEEIADFLAGDLVKRDHFYSLLSSKSVAMTRHTSVNRIVVEKTRGRKSELFNVDFEGARARLAINTNHLFFEAMSSTEVVDSNVAKSLVALELAARLIGDGESYEVQHTLDRLLMEFSRQLGNLFVAEVSGDS